MNCETTRERLAAEPWTTDATVGSHLRDCADCRAYQADLRRLDGQLRAVMTVDVPAPRRRPAWKPRAVGMAMAMAAGIAGVAVVAGLLWIAQPRAALADDVVRHMAHEPYAWERAVALPADSVRRFLAARGLRLDASSPDVAYMQSCFFRGRMVPHLVVLTDTGPVTVLMLQHEDVTGPTEFEQDGYRGTILPATRGSIAIIVRGPTDVDAVAARIREAVHFDG